MNAKDISILMYGHDTRLLETSRWALQSCGYKVLTATQQDELKSIPQKPPINLLVLSHALGDQQRDEAAAQASARWPGVKSLVLNRDNFIASGSVADKLQPALNIPEWLLAKIGRLIGYAGSSPCSHIY